MSAAAIAMKPKSEMSEAEILALEEAEFHTGPLSLLTTAVKSNAQILIMTRYCRALSSINFFLKKK